MAEHQQKHYHSRRSISKRQNENGHTGSPLPRSRSQERSISHLEECMIEGLSIPSSVDDGEEYNVDDSSSKGSDEKGIRPTTAGPPKLERATSDPFDNAGSEEEDEDGDVFHTPNGSPHQQSSPPRQRRRAESSGDDVSLPTLARYPCAETKDMHCWSISPIDIFYVRGPKYLSGNKKKVKSGPFLLQPRGVDLLLSENPPNSIGQTRGVLGGKLRQTPTFIVNLRFPWGVLALYFEIPDKLVKFVNYDNSTTANGISASNMQGLTVPEQTLAKFFMGDDTHRNNTLKLVPFVAEGPWAARNLVTGKPAIIGNKLPVQYFGSGGTAKNNKAVYLEAVMDIGSGSNTAKRIVSVCRRYMNLLTTDFGLVIQGNTPDELPEQMLGAIRIHSIDPLLAPTVNFSN
mmetsp:Transcript_21010/g.29660  ORF Transcript_21010/g.29660 Transcript_21010/m.29660 type:complete len:402 (-) Transcript_21010:383-1588(-)